MKKHGSLSKYYVEYKKLDTKSIGFNFTKFKNRPK